MLAAPPIPSTRATRPLLVLAVVLVAALAINLDTTIVNVALPALNRQLGAGTSGLQWVVDGYNLAFAALVLAGGTIGDRRGRRATLGAGLGLFALSSVAAALAGNLDTLIAVRLVMGASAALIYPTTLSVITTTFTDRKQRAAAIGAWGAVTGVGVAAGPILGGALLSHFWWGSVFLALVPVALLALVGVGIAVPPSSDPDRLPLDRAGLGASVAGLGALVYTIIEAPRHGWLDARTLVGFGFAAAALGWFVRWERRRPAPLIDVSLFSNLRFTAASGAVTVAFFGLFGFIFLITQYFQQLRGFSPLSTGVRILPVAFSVAVSSLLGVRLAVRFGSKIVVTAGLVSLSSAFLWISFGGADLPYPIIAAQMVLLGGGMGLTSAPATEAIMGVVRPEQAGAGSAVNDATREIGGTLGVAVIGSVFSSLYARSVTAAGGRGGVAPAVVAHARRSFGDGLAAAGGLRAGGQPGAFHHDVETAFLSGLHAGCRTAAVVCGLGAVVVAALLPAHAGARDS